MSERVGSWITTYSGRRFFPADPMPDEVCVEDIAHALSNVCRFGGHCASFYSVAQHSVLVSEIVPPHLALNGLMHDAAEAYVGDLVSPIKWHLRKLDRGRDSVFDLIESAVAVAISKRLSLPRLSREEDALVKRADLVALATERRDLLRPDGSEWPCLIGIEPDPRAIVPQDPRSAKLLFRSRFEWLNKMRGFEGQVEP